MDNRRFFPRQRFHQFRGSVQERFLPCFGENAFFYRFFVDIRSLDRKVLYA
jgi:hypothetical protein